MSYLNRLIEAQNQDLHAARSYIERAEAEKRELSIEERTAWDALNAQMDQRAEHIEEVRRDEMRTRNVEAALADAPEARAAAPVEAAKVSDADILRKLANGEMRSHTFKVPSVRAMSQGTTTAGGFTVPEDFGGRIIEKLLTVGRLLDPSLVTLIQTDHGRDIPFPIQNARPAGTATAEGATFAVSDPSFTEKTLKAWKYSTLVVGSEELFSSEGVGLEDYLARQMGVALGTAINSAITLGTGTVQPEGLISGMGTVAASTGGTGVTGAPTYENLVDLVHSVDSLYASAPSTAFMMNRATLGVVRKIKDGNGAYIFVPAANSAMPSTLLGYNVVENPYMATAAVNAKSIAFGDFSYLVVRQAGGITVERSDEAYWTSDQVAWKVRTRVDSFVGQAEAIKYFVGGTA
jgi:HK97 family phage major capsid protein